MRANESQNVAFASQWHNYPERVRVPLAAGSVRDGDVVWLLISGSTNSMQTRLS